MSRRRMMMQTQSSPNVRTELEVYSADTVIVKIENRTFKKTNDGFSIVGYCHRINNSGSAYTSPIIVSPDFDAATIHVDSIVMETYRSFEYDGILYHCGQLDYAVSGHVTDISGLNRWLINGGEVFTNDPENAAIQAGRALLDYYFYKS